MRRISRKSKSDPEKACTFFLSLFFKGFFFMGGDNLQILLQYKYVNPSLRLGYVAHPVRKRKKTWIFVLAKCSSWVKRLFLKSKIEIF